MRQDMTPGGDAHVAGRDLIMNVPPGGAPVPAGSKSPAQHRQLSGSRVSSTDQSEPAPGYEQCCYRHCGSCGHDWPGMGWVACKTQPTSARATALGSRRTCVDLFAQADKLEARRNRHRITIRRRGYMSQVADAQLNTSPAPASSCPVCGLANHLNGRACPVCKWRTPESPQLSAEHDDRVYQDRLAEARTRWRESGRRYRRRAPGSANSLGIGSTLL